MHLHIVWFISALINVKENNQQLETHTHKQLSVIIQHQILNHSFIFQQNNSMGCFFIRSNVENVPRP